MTDVNVTIGVDETFLSNPEDYDDEHTTVPGAVTVQQGAAIDHECLCLNFYVNDDGCAREAGVWLTRPQAEALANVLLGTAASLPMPKKAEVSVG